MHSICGSLVNAWERRFISFDFSCIVSYATTSMSSMHVLKLCKILADHDQCIQWCKEHNLLASSIKCLRGIKIVVIHGRGRHELHLEMSTNGDVRKETAMAWHPYAH